MRRKFLSPLTLDQAIALTGEYKLPFVIDPHTDRVHPEVSIDPNALKWDTQYDSLSAKINYALTRIHQPTVVVEFGTRGGRCTHDILQALIDNNKEYIFKPYELEKYFRDLANKNLSEAFGDKAPLVGGDIMKSGDVPDNIDYLFVDNYHDYETTKWVFEYLLPEKCVPNCLVQFHDLVIYGNGQFEVAGGTPEGGEMLYMHELIKQEKFPLIKLFWGWETGVEGFSSTWWYYVKD